MKNLLRLVSILLVLCLWLTSCGNPATIETETETETGTDVGNETETESETEESMYSKRAYTMLDAKGLYKPLGRTDMDGTSQTCDWTASGAEFLMDCRGEVEIVFTSAGSNCLMIIVDGQVTKDFPITSGTRTYTIAKDLEPGLHTLRIVAQYAYTQATLDKILLYGTLQKVEDAEVYIEFIGDSITCGSGLSSNGTNDGTMAYSYIAADILGVDYSICCNGGMGVAFSGGDGTNIVDNVYPFQNAKRNNNLYTPTRTPSLVVINLHTNDNWQWFSQAKNKTDHEVFNYINFDVAFDKLIATLDGLYGLKAVPILFVFGCMANDTYSVASDRMLDLIEKKYLPAGYDMKVVTLSTDRTGVSSHPAPAGAKKQGEELAAYIKEIYGDLFN